MVRCVDCSWCSARKTETWRDCDASSTTTTTPSRCVCVSESVCVRERVYWCFSTAWYGTVRHGSVRYGAAQFAFPPQFSTAIEWAGLFTRRYNCAASTAVTSS